jgi:acyl dehydratase
MSAEAEATTQLVFQRLPSLGRGYLRALFLRKRGLAPGSGAATLSRIEARIAGVAVDPARLAGYRRVCGFPVSLGLPPTYPHVLAAPLHVAMFTSAAFPLPVPGLIHVRNAIVQRRTIPAGARLDIACTLEGHREVENGIEFDLYTHVAADGEAAWEGVTTILRKTKAPRGDHAGKPAHPVPPLPPAGDEPGRARSVAWKLREDTGRRYAGVSGDYNPIHLRATTAKLFGFPRAIAHGMWSLARCLAEIADDAPPPPLRIEVEFKRPVLLPSEVLFSSGPAGAGGAASFALKSRDGKPHLLGRVERA